MTRDHLKIYINIFHSHFCFYFYFITQLEAAQWSTLQLISMIKGFSSITSHHHPLNGMQKWWKALARQSAPHKIFRGQKCDASVWWWMGATLIAFFNWIFFTEMQNRIGMQFAWRSFYSLIFEANSNLLRSKPHMQSCLWLLIRRIFHLTELWAITCGV